MKYIIAVVEGTRFDLAPKYTGKAHVYHYGHFNLIFWAGGDYRYDEYQEVYQEVADYVACVNKELKDNQYFRGWCYAEMLTPNEHEEYNDIRCKLFHTWFVDKLITADEIIVTKINVAEKDIHDRIDVYREPEKVMRIARVISSELLNAIHVPGDYIHGTYMNSSTNIFLPDQPIFEFGYTLPYSIQIVDVRYSKFFKKD